MDIRLDGKRALVTGANSGIGKAIALALGEAGADVAINYIANPDEAEEVSKMIKSNGRKSLTIKADISDPQQVAKMFDTINDEWNGLDILVNNAGINSKKEFIDVTDEDFDTIIHTNIKSVFSFSREVVKVMKKPWWQHH